MKLILHRRNIFKVNITVIEPPATPQTTSSSEVVSPNPHPDDNTDVASESASEITIENPNEIDDGINNAINSMNAAINNQLNHPGDEDKQANQPENTFIPEVEPEVEDTFQVETLPVPAASACIWVEFYHHHERYIVSHISKMI